MRKYRLLSAATTNLTSVKASQGRIHQLHLHNSSAAAKFVKLYDKASAPVLAADTPVATIPIAAGATVILKYEGDMRFDTGIALAVTNLVADTDATAVAANDVVLNMLYQ